MSEHKKTNKKKIILTALFVLFNIIVIAYTAFSELSKVDTAENFFNLSINWNYFLLAIVVFVIAIFAESSKYSLMLKKLCGNTDAETAAEVALLGRYYDNVTPSGIGGQPFQIYYLNHKGVSGGNAAVITVSGFINMQFAFCILALSLFIANNSALPATAVRIASYVGLVFYMALPTAIILFTLFPVSMEKIITNTLKLCAKCKMIKDLDLTTEKALRALNEYSTEIKVLIKIKGLETSLMMLSIVYQLAICSLPYFAVKMFGGQISWINAVTTTLYIYAAITFIPTPGNAGAAEGSFYLIFSMLTTGRIFWAMLVWRFFVYYLFIIIGIAIYIKNYFKARREARRIASRSTDFSKEFLHEQKSVIS